MENKKVAKVLILIVVLLTFSVLAVLIFKRVGPSNVADNKNVFVGTSVSALVAEPAILETYPLEIKKIKVYLTDKNGGKSEVTNSVLWTSDKPELVDVSNADPIRGQVVAQKEGSYSIKASYQGKEITIPVKVSKSELKIVCKADPPTAKVGQKVVWVMMFEKIGTPRYTYSITGSEGLNGKEGLATITYKTPGTKNVQMKVVDSLGTEAAVACDPYEVLAK